MAASHNFPLSSRPAALSRVGARAAGASPDFHSAAAAAATAAAAAQRRSPASPPSPLASLRQSTAGKRCRRNPAALLCWFGGGRGGPPRPACAAAPLLAGALLCICASLSAAWAHVRLRTTYVANPWSSGGGGGGAGAGAASAETRARRPLCIIGNAPGIKDARRVHEMWGGAFPAVYYGWQRGAEAMEKAPGADVWLVSDGTQRSFRDGTHYALEKARSLLNCKYFFLHDDDLTFRFNEELQLPSRAHHTLQDELLEILHDYEPAFATFLWEAGLRHEGVRATYHAHRKSRVYPFTAGDSGMTIYHHSIVDFFIPFPPHGEAAFVGNWTLATHFIDLFARTVFDGIIINSIRYKNNVNPDNHDRSGPKWTVLSNRIAVSKQSRHKYEWPQNSAYLRFLYSCVRDLRTPRARELVALSNISNPWYTTSRGSKAFAHADESGTYFDVPSVIQRLMKVADPRHPALSSSHYMRSPEAQAVVNSLVPNTPVDLRVAIMAYRAGRFENALSILSTLAAELEREKHFQSENVSISVVFMVDFDPSISEETRQELRINATSIYGLIVFDMATSHRGLKKSWLEGWKPSLLDSFNLVLEDDLEVSSNLLRSSLSLIRSVYYGTQYPFDEIIGISLFNERNSDIALSVPEPSSKLIETSHTLRQSICSWGIIFAAPGWHQFLAWLDKVGQDYDPALKDALSNRWPIRKSWKKLALRFGAERNMYVYYPLFRGGESLVRKLVLIGGTNDRKPSEVHVGLRLMNRELTVSSNALSAPRLDYKMEPVISTFSSFDGCTMVMPICHRLGTVPMLLKHYAEVPFKAQIILVQQPCGGSHRALDIPDHINGVEIVLKRMAKNDMNNRYINFDEIKYDCIISLDDDVMHPHDSMNQLVRFWKQHYFDFYVGWNPQSRIHVVENGEYIYRNYSGVREFGGIASMLLPSGTVYHRRFLDAYNSEPNREARGMVSQMVNCDDILMNFVIANATNKGPVLLEDLSSLKRSDNLKALSDSLTEAQWKDPHHLSERTKCINAFVTIYGRMPLRYSTVMYKYDKSVRRRPVRLLGRTVVRYLFADLIPNRSTMRSVPDLCNHTGLHPTKQHMACMRRATA